MKTALVTGITGQDGAYLARLLLEKGYIVVGAYRRSSCLNLWRLDELGITLDVELVPFELLEESNVKRVLDKVRPDELYNLAAQTFVGVSFEQPIFTCECNGLGVARILEGIREVNPHIKFYQASTSEMFGKVKETPQNEQTPFHPRSPYGVAKLYAHWLTVNYREAHHLFACCGILFNHESPLRGPEFATRKITMGLSRIKEGKQEYLSLGNLDARRDWGFAGDYVEAMWLMLQQAKPDDYVIATGQSASVRDFCNLTADALDMTLDWEGEGIDERAIWAATGKTVIRVSPTQYRPAEVELLIGDPRKAYSRIGWQAKTTLRQLVSIMAEADSKG